MKYDIDITIGPPPSVTFSGESTAVVSIQLYDVKAIVHWANNNAVWEYRGYDLVETLRTLTNTDSLGKTAWVIKRSADVAFNITEMSHMGQEKENNNA